VDELTRADGTLSPVFLRVSGDALEIVIDPEPLLLPRGALEAVMRRFGRPLEPSTHAGGLVEVGALDLGPAAEGRLRHVRHRAFFDVIARDYLIYEAPGSEPLCALAITVAGALGHLGRAAIPA
jgi:hypothetical protein